MLAGMEAAEKRRWYCPTPGWLVYGSLAVTSGIWLSNRFGWPAWHKGYPVLTTVAAVGVVVMLTFLWYLAALIFRLRFQFSVRSVLAMTVAVALPCSWWAVEMKQAREQEASIKAIKKLGGWVLYDWEREENILYLPGMSLPNAPEPTWLRNLLGDDFFSNVLGVSLHYSQDVGMPYVAGFRQLESLELGRSELTGPSLTNAGMAHIAGLTKLQELNLVATPITDVGLAQLSRLTELRLLCLEGTQVTAAGMAKLRQALPNCHIRGQ